VKKNRFFALILALMMLWLPCAQATDHIVSYLLPEGSQLVSIRDFDQLEIPEGLEDMYAMFADGNTDATVYIFRMPNGRALLSVSCLETDMVMTGDELYAMRDSIADGLCEQFGTAMPERPELEQEVVCGYDGLGFSTTLQFGQNGDLPVEVESGLFFRDTDLMEVWAVAVEPSYYAADSAAAAELESDQNALVSLIDSLDFSIPEETSGNEPEPETKPADPLASGLDALIAGLTNEPDEPEAQPVAESFVYVAPDGLFSMEVPGNTLIITSGSDADIVAAGRNAFAHINGSQDCFDQWYAEVLDQNCTLIICPDQGVVAQVFVSGAGDFAGFTVDDFKQMEQPVLALMQQSYESAEVSDEATEAEMDGLDHAWLTYWIEHKDANLLSYVLAAADDQYLYELDAYLFITEDMDQDAAVNTVVTMMDTLDYLPQSQL